MQTLSNILQKGKQKCLISSKAAQTTQNTSTFLQWVKSMSSTPPTRKSTTTSKTTSWELKKTLGMEEQQTALHFSHGLHSSSLACSPLLSRIKEAVLSRVFSLWSSPTKKHGQAGNEVKKKILKRFVTSGSERSCKILVVTISFSQQ